jgi:MoaA/NifB/PqqE/SkfB family radical SAM enzyme
MQTREWYNRFYAGFHNHLRTFAGGRFAALVRPTSVLLLITERCNARCCHCDIWQNRGKEDSPTLEQWKAALTDVRRWLGPVQVVLTGGEALLIPFTPELVQHGSSIGLLLEVLSHGYWRDQSRVEALAMARPWRITMSLDGLGERHSKIRGRDEFFERTMTSFETFERLRREHHLGYAIRFKTVVMRHNLDQLAPLARFASREGVDIFYQPIEQNYNTPEDPEWWLHSDNWPENPQEAVAGVRELIRLKGEGLHIANSMAQLEAMVAYFEDPASLRLSTQSHAAHEKKLPCAALELMQVQSNGDVRTCNSRPPIGNIKDTPLSTLWRTRPEWWKAGCCLEQRLRPEELYRIEARVAPAPYSLEPAPSSSPVAAPPA